MHARTPSADAIQVLRRATQDVHERLHVAEPFRRITDKSLDKGGYARLLQSILRFHSAVQPVLAAAPATAILAGGRERIRQLETDVRELGEHNSIGTPAWRLDGDEAATGCLYVVQGSTIGGRVIFRQLEYLFGSDCRGRTFFAGTRHDAARWKEVRDLVEKKACRPGSLTAMTRGARATFSLFENCLAEAAP